MSKEYREKTGKELEPSSSSEMRAHCQRPGKKNHDGSICYFTEQQYKDTCDVNKIIQKYDKHGLITHVSTIEAKYGDMTGADYKTAMDLVVNMRTMFNELPSEIRKRFDNSPEKYLTFMENPENRKEAIELGLINPNWTDATDGLGEHIKTDAEREKIDETVE